MTLALVGRLVLVALAGAAWASPASAQTQDDLFDDTRLHDVHLRINEDDWTDASPERPGRHLLPGGPGVERDHRSQRRRCDSGGSAREPQDKPNSAWT